MSSRTRAILVGFLAVAACVAAPQAFVTQGAGAQSRVTILGSVVDTGLTPLPGVVVTIERNGVQEARAITDAKGEFRLPDLAPGVVRVRAEGAGFAAATRDVRIPADVPTVRLPIALAAGQGATSATLNGIVKDRDGNVPGATVVLRNVATGETFRPVVTNASGAYAFPGLAPAKYRVTIAMQNYKTVETEVQLSAGSTNSLTTTIELGKREEVVSVTAGAELIRTDTPTVSQSVNSNFIQTLPRNDREALSYLVFMPGVSAPPAAPAPPAARLNAVEEVTLTTATGAAGAGGGGGRGAGGQSRTIAGLPGQQVNITIDGITNRYLPGETYSQFEPNHFQSALDHPLSTFGADVDTASYSNIRRFLSSGQLPPSEAVRIEELVNYFRFGYAAPRDGRPIALTTEIGDCPWAPTHKLVLIGARAALPAPREITGRNIVLLIDVSGSMAPPERLPLIKTALALFADTLRPDDTLAIVTYAGSSGIALPPTPARRRDVIQQAIAGLNAGGSTNGGEGLMLAYRIARQAFKPGGVNRVVLATDGDFNVGITSQQELLALIERERGSGVFLSVFGVGSGNLKDRTMEMLADRGNGNYAYLDSLQEARRVLIREGDATLEAVAKDVKFQVEFNPAVVSAWKLIGYENRRLAAQDFNNDRKDAGEMGAGHTVTVLYEVIPMGVPWGIDDRESDRPAVDPLKYQPQAPAVRPATRPVVPTPNGEWLTVKTRYKLPEGETSELITKAVRPGGVQFLPLASAVAEFGLILRDAPRDAERWDSLTWRTDRLAVPPGLTADVEGFRELIATARGLARIR